MINRYIIAAFVSVTLVALSYVYNFYFELGYKVSSSTSDWAQLGDYLGGVLSPILTFISLVLLIKSLNLQNEANASLKKQLENSETTEKLKSFESLFFNLITAQNELYDLFNIDIPSSFGSAENKVKVEAVMSIEDEIEKLRGEGASTEEISGYLENLDDKDAIFGIVRAFFITVKLITDKLSEKNGFNLEDRKMHYHTLINFTDFSQLRLIILSVQFLEYHPTKYLRNHKELISVIDELDLSFSAY